MGRTLRQCATSAALLILLIMSTGASSASAQSDSVLHAGVRVRLKSDAGAQWVQGNILAVNDTLLTLETSPRSSPVVVSLEKITRLERSLRRSWRKRGAAIGLGIGAATGFILSATESCPPPDPENIWGDNCPDFGLAQDVIAALVVGAVGAGLGALVAPGEKWQPVTTGPLHVTVTPHAGGLRLGLSLSF